MQAIRERAWQAAVWLAVLLSLALAARSAAAFVGEPVGGRAAFDFHGTLWGAGRAVLDGRSPYAVDAVEALARAARPDRAFPAWALPVYPAPAVLAGVPFALLPASVAAALFLLAVVAAVGLTLVVLDVRDPRLWVLAYASGPTVHALALGGVTPLLALGAAIAWRTRERRWAPAVAVAAAVAFKLFLWPLLLWLVLSGRAATAGRAAALAVAGTLAAWAAIGFDGLTSYPHLASLLPRIELGHDRSVASALLELGVPADAARPLAACVALAGVGLLLASGVGPDADRRSFTAALALAVVASPVVWGHYLAVLLPAVAIAPPRWRPAAYLAWFALWPAGYPASFPLEATWLQAVPLAALVVCAAPGLRQAARRAAPRSQAAASASGIGRANR